MDSKYFNELQVYSCSKKEKHNREWEAGEGEEGGGGGGGGGVVNQKGQVTDVGRLGQELEGLAHPHVVLLLLLLGLTSLHPTSMLTT